MSRDNNRESLGGITATRKLLLIKTILAVLGDVEWRYTKLQSRTIKTNTCSAATFNMALSFALKRGWVGRPRRGVYVRTEKGKALMKVL